MKTSASEHRYDVFFSYHSSNGEQVEILAARLEDEASLKVFLDRWHLKAGEPWQEELEEALDQSAACAVFLGPGGLGAWENEEMRSALDDRVRNKSLRVIPVLLPQADPNHKQTLPRFLRRLTWVDFRAGLDDKQAFQHLVAGIRGLPPGRPRSVPENPPPLARPTGSLFQYLRGMLSSVLAAVRESSTELKKIIAGAVAALVLSAPFINAAIPK